MKKMALIWFIIAALQLGCEESYNSPHDKETHEEFLCCLDSSVVCINHNFVKDSALVLGIDSLFHKVVPVTNCGNDTLRYNRTLYGLYSLQMSKHRELDGNLSTNFSDPVPVDEDLIPPHTTKKLLVQNSDKTIISALLSFECGEKEYNIEVSFE
jgi:hypothetical protein